jgi:hypothetical protein
MRNDVGNRKPMLRNTSAFADDDVAVRRIANQIAKILASTLAYIHDAS